MKKRNTVKIVEKILFQENLMIHMDNKEVTQRIDKDHKVGLVSLIINLAIWKKRERVIMTEAMAPNLEKQVIKEAIAD